MRIATGEHCHNRMMFKQLMQAGGLGVCRLDACRQGGVNEVLAVSLLAPASTSQCVRAAGAWGCSSTYSPYRSSSTSRSGTISVIA